MVTWQAIAYAVIFLAWAVVEVTGLVQKDTPQAPRTLSAVLRWLVNSAGWWHTVLRVLFVAFLGWFGPHILGH